MTNSEQSTPRVAVITGSTRSNRICHEIAAWALRLLRAGSDLHYELVDLLEINLPFLDEPLIPAFGNYAHDHTKAWSAEALDDQLAEALLDDQHQPVRP